MDDETERVQRRAAEIRAKRGMPVPDPAIDESMSQLYEEHEALTEVDDGYRNFRPEVLEGLAPKRKRPHGCIVPEPKT